MSNVEYVRIAISRIDGGLSIMSFITKEFTSTGELRWEHMPTEEAVQAEVVRTMGARALGWRRIVETDIPTDRYFRDAWHDTGVTLDVDMPKAREIHRNVLRRQREPLLAALDTEYMRADEAGDVLAKRRIAAKKQALRDVTLDPRIDAATTPDELKAVIPAALLGV